MKILIYTEKFYPSLGGIENSSRLIAEYLYSKGIDVSVVTDTPFTGKEPFSFNVVRQPNNTLFKKLIAATDLVYTSGFYVKLYLISKIKRKKLVVSYRDLTLVCPKGTKWHIDRPCICNASLVCCIPCLKATGELMIFRRLLRPYIKTVFSLFINGNVCISSFGYKNFNLWKKRLIYNGIDTSFFKPLTGGKKNQTCRIVFVGRLIPEKGCQVLIEALQKIKEYKLDFKLSICGDGPYRSDLEKLSYSCGLKKDVYFHGGVYGKELLSIIQHADIFIVPSIWDEPFGLTAVEAMSCGLPVIASDVGGLGDVVREAGLVFKRGDVEGLVRHIKRLLEDERYRKDIEHKARYIAVQKYDYKRMAEEYYILFKTLLKKHHTKYT